MELKKAVESLLMVVFCIAIGWGCSSKSQQPKTTENQEVNEIESMSTEIDSGGVELDTKTEDLEESLNELNTEN